MDEQLDTIDALRKKVALNIWGGTLLLILGVAALCAAGTEISSIIYVLPFAIALAVVGIPALALLYYITSKLEVMQADVTQKITYLHTRVFCICLFYASPALLISFFDHVLPMGLLYLGGTALVFYAPAFLSILINEHSIRQFLISSTNYYFHHNPSTQKNNTMQEDYNRSNANDNFSVIPVSNKILIKGIVTAALILLMLIPSSFIQSLITERQQRQATVVEEVSSKWAAPQTVSTPYLVIPYVEGKLNPQKKQLVILPEQLDVKGNISEEERPRSIYKVLLYRSRMNLTGSFRTTIALPDADTLLTQEAKLCFGISDFRGIEDKITLALNGKNYTMLPGLPANVIDSTGLSVPVSITQADIEKGFNFSLDAALRGSGQLHFVPLAANSTFNFKSAWPGPSFDGNSLPTQRSISSSGFDATWRFTNANMPFTNVINNTKNIDKQNIEFGVSLVQPADQYVKSMRSAKYAILIIALTFVVFFVFELFQKRPVHPVQYALVGVALVIFYTLLVSISEIILFDYAYTIAAVATIVLISLYAGSHFKTTHSAVIFGLLLTGLYGFIYVLISLEDTALLVGSIALFIVLAIVMYVTRKINWYQPEMPAPGRYVQP